MKNWKMIYFTVKKTIVDSYRKTVLTYKWYESMFQ